MHTLKQDKKFKHPIILIIYIIFIFTLGISYSYLTTTLKINGIASIDGYLWPEEILPTIPEKSENGSQFSDSFKSEYLTGNPISNTAQNRFENIVENYDIATSTYTINIKKKYKIGQIISRDTETFNLNFTIKNLSNLTWENGTVNINSESSSNLLSNVSGNIDKTTLAPNDTATLNMQFTLVIYGKFGIIEYTDKITYQINYLVDNEIKTTTVIINFT